MTEPTSHPSGALAASPSLLRELPADTLVGFVFADSQPLGGALGLVDWQLCGLLSETIVRGHFAAQQNERLLVPTFGRLRAKQLLIFGLGPTLACEQRSLQHTIGDVRAVLSTLGCVRAAILLPAVADAEPATWHAHAQFCAERVQRGLSAPGQGFSAAAFLAAPGKAAGDSEEMFRP